MNPVAIRADNLSLGYRQRTVLQDIQLQLPQGQAIAIIGPNGAGKSTLLKGLMGLIPVQTGQVRFFDQPLKRNPTRVAYIPQRQEIDWDFPITVLDLVLMGRQGHLKFWQRPSAQDQALARDCLAQLDMLAFADRQISELSGGQQQRAFIAHALAQQADIYLMDEPFAGIDLTTEKALIDLFTKLKARQQTLVCVHHDLNTLRDYFDWVVMINQRLIASGPVEQAWNLLNVQNAFEGRLPTLQSLGLTPGYEVLP
jgi:manganese/zinc/iron transport system ATP- binding protein